ncbi:MAG TPA: ATP-binding protein, partial [Thermoanaerobaculaceae bacterium]|nr:ATP-binding protein [Thermoanaerobaculaceae bacterium]
LASKLILALTLIVLIVKGLALYVNVTTQERQLLHSMTLGADQLSRSITSATWQTMLADRRDAAYEVMRKIAEKQGVDRIRMFNKDGRLMFSTIPSEKLQVDKLAEVCSPCHSTAEPLVKVDVPNRARVYRAASGLREMTMITPIYNEPSCSEASCHAHPASVSVLGVLDLGIDLKPVDDEMRVIRDRTLALTAVEVLLVGVFIVFFTRHFVANPIRHFTDAAKAISEMQLDQPVAVRSSVELEDLSHSFNVMRERLKAAMAENAEFTQRLESKVEERTAQLRAAQQKLLQNDRLASLGQLAASVAHEINNPISGVLNLSMLMQRIVKEDGIPAGRVEEVRRYLSQVAGETARVGRIVSDLLAFSRRSKPQSSQADLNAIVRTTVSLVAHKLELANVKVELDLADHLPSLRCDASQIQQVVMNLVLNGAEAIKGGGSVGVSTAADPAHEAVMLAVRDTGSGIAPEMLGKIFDPFFTTKEEGKGVGLGLAVVYGIVEAHGGEIEVDSSVGKGSTFRVRLPLEPPGAKPAGEAGNGI